MKKLFACSVLLLLWLTACSHSAECPVADDELPALIVDTDIGGCTDDLFALAMLHRYVDEGRCRLLGVVVDRPGEENAMLADVLNTFYGHSSIPIALARGGLEGGEIWTDYRDLPHYTDAQGVPLIRGSLTDVADLPDGYRLYRRLLASAPEGSVRICSIGFVNVLASLLLSQGDEYSPLSGIELVRRKVKSLYIMAGSFASEPQVEYNLSRCLEASHTFFDLWPAEVPICFSPAEVGETIDYPVEQVLADFSSLPPHPIQQVYQRCRVDEDQRMWDPLVVLQAVEGDALFTLSEPGRVWMDDSARTYFEPDAQGRCRYQKPGTATWCQAVLHRIRSLAAAPIAPSVAR